MAVEGLPTVAEGGTSQASTPRKEGGSGGGRDSPASPFRSPKEGGREPKSPFKEDEMAREMRMVAAHRRQKCHDSGH